MLDHQRYDARFLSNANKAAAKVDGEPTWCNATWLVKLDKAGKPGAFLRAKEIGLSDRDLFVVLRDGNPVAVDTYDEADAVEGDLFVSTELAGIRVKSGLQLLREEADVHTVEEWAEIAGVDPRDVVAVAQEFTSHGKKAAADLHRGVSQHTNGFYNVLAWYSLNLLIGNYDWKGGMVKATTYDAGGGKEGQPFPIGKLMPGKSTPFGISLLRHGVKYEETTLFAGYPARRPWFPLSSDLYQEIVPSAGDAYPYPIKALFLYMGSPVYALPAGHTNIPILRDVQKVPLFVTSDILIGETSMYADYIFPDLSYLERWEFHGSHPSVAPKIQPVRQPVIPPIPETVKIFGEKMPISIEALLLAIAERLGLPGFGKDGFGPGQAFTHPDHLYLRMVANVAAGDKPGDTVPVASDDEVKLFVESRRHLPKTVFDPARWKGIVGGELWRKVIYVLNRGGRFQGYEAAYDGDKVANTYGTLINLYQEKTATTKNSMTGKPFPGVATYIPAPLDSLGRLIKDEAYDLRLITYREISHTKSRTIANYWLLHLLAENSVIMNAVDAKRLGLRTGETVKIVSATNPEGVWDLGNGRKRPMAGKLNVIEGIRPGVVAFSLGHGHWAYGASDVVVDGKIIKGDARRSAGIHANAAMRVDPVLGNTCLSDLTGGSAVFYDTQVKVLKV